MATTAFVKTAVADAVRYQADNLLDKEIQGKKVRIITGSQWNDLGNARESTTLYFLTSVPN